MKEDKHDEKFHGKYEQNESNKQAHNENVCDEKDNHVKHEENKQANQTQNNNEESCNNETKTNVQDKAQEYLELAQRIKAEFENYKKRNAEITTTSFNNGVVTAVTKILPCIDSFSQAKSNISDPAVLSGVELIYNQLMKGLSELNVEKIDCLGKLFDPNLHNAVLVGKDDAYPEDTILEEYQAGFVLNGKVIRPSTVKVNKLD